MKNLILLGISLVLLIFSARSSAQTYPCPNPGPGEVVVGQTAGGQGVAPIQLCEQANQPQGQSSASPALTSVWGAIASDDDKGVVGSASGSAARALAELTAISDCKGKGGSACKLQVSYANACGAFVVGDQAYAADWGATKEQAIAKATKVCSTKSKNCQAYFTACSYPTDIQ